MTRVVAGVAVDRNLSIHWRMQKIRKVAGVVGVTVLLAALAGLFGAGPMSSAEIQSAGFNVEYQRFLRALAPSVVIVRVEGQPELWISQDYLRQISMDQIMPRPSTVRSEGEWTVFQFEGNTAATIRFTIEAARGGRITGRIRGRNTPEYELTHWIYP